MPKIIFLFFLLVKLHKIRQIFFERWFLLNYGEAGAATSVNITDWVVKTGDEFLGIAGFEVTLTQLTICILTSRINILFSHIKSEIVACSLEILALNLDILSRFRINPKHLLILTHHINLCAHTLKQPRRLSNNFITRPSILILIACDEQERMHINRHHC